MQPQPEPIHSELPDPPAPEGYRARSGIVAAGLLGLLALVAMVGAFMPYVVGVHDAVAPWLLSAGFVAVAVLAISAALMESRRSRRAETVYAFAIALAVALTWASVQNGWYLFSPFMVVATLFALLGLAHRAFARDEMRHVSRARGGAL